MSLFTINIAYDFNLDFSMSDENGSNVNPTKLAFTVEKGKLDAISFEVEDHTVMQNISLSAENVKLSFNYKDRYVLNHDTKSEFHAYLGNPKSFNVVLDLTPDAKKDLFMNLIF